VPTMIGFDLGLRAYESGNVAVEVVVDVSDLNGDHVLSPGDSASFMPIPKVDLVPPKP